MGNIKCDILNERELTQCIKYNPDSIEEGLSIIDTFFQLSDGREIDILALDQDKRLVIMELKHKEDSKQLSQALGYYDWVLNNFDTIKKLYPKEEINDAPPRLVLIAENYSEDIITLGKYLKESIAITLYRYIPIEVDGKKQIVCNDVELPSAPEIITVTTESDLYEYIVVPDVKKGTMQLIEKIRKLDLKVTAEAKNWWGFSIKYDGRVFGEIYVKKKYIHTNKKMDVYDNDSWDWDAEVRTKKQFDKQYNKFKKAFQNAKEKL